MNQRFEGYLGIELSGPLRQQFEAGLLACADWESRKHEMPPWAEQVVTGEAFYCGCEGIGHTLEFGWYLVLWEPTDEPEPRSEPVGDTGLTLTGVQICSGPTKEDPGKLTLLYAQSQPVFQHDTNAELSADAQTPTIR